jgi:hypothetical protein
MPAWLYELKLAKGAPAVTVPTAKRFRFGMDGTSMLLAGNLCEGTSMLHTAQWSSLQADARGCPGSPWPTADAGL